MSAADPKENTALRGAIYAIADNGDLLWYRHEGHFDGTPQWANGGHGQTIGNGWNFKHVFSGGKGVVYAVTDNGDLLLYRHEGHSDGTPQWANGGHGQTIGNGWNFKHVFSGGDGLFYAV